MEEAGGLVVARARAGLLVRRPASVPFGHPRPPERGLSRRRPSEPGAGDRYHTQANPAASASPAVELHDCVL